MTKDKVLILGAGHLTYRIKRLAEKRGYQVVQPQIPDHEDQNDIIFDDIQGILSQINLDEVVMAYVVDTKDAYNLAMVIALISVDEDVPITVSLFNENITPHLKATHPNIHIINPAKIAAPKFVESLDLPTQHFLRYEFVPIQNALLLKNSDPFLRLITGLFAGSLIVVLAYFTLVVKVPLIEALYFVIAIVVGGTDLLWSTPVNKWVEIALIFGSMAFVWVIFTLTADYVIKMRSERALGHKKYSYKNHVIVCGLGRLGHFVVDELMRRGERVVVIETDEQAPSVEYYRSRGVDVYIGNARLVRVLQDVSVAKAKALMCLVSDDYVNLEIGLNARSCNPGIKLVLRVFDDAMTATIRDHLDIQFAHSVSALTDDVFLAVLDAKKS